MNNAQEIKQLKKDIIKGHAKNKYKNQGVQFTADQVVASLQEEQKAHLQDSNKARMYEEKKKANQKIVKAVAEIQKIYDIVDEIKDKDEKKIIHHLFQDLSDKLLDNV